MTTIDELLAKLKKRVDKEGLRDTARFLDVDPATVHNYLQGKRRPSGEIVLKLMAKLP